MDSFISRKELANVVGEEGDELDNSAVFEKLDEDGKLNKFFLLHFISFICFI